jgi:hypothetical protein
VVSSFSFGTKKIQRGIELNSTVPQYVWRYCTNVSRDSWLTSVVLILVAVLWVVDDRWPETADEAMNCYHYTIRQRRPMLALLFLVVFSLCLPPTVTATVRFKDTEQKLRTTDVPAKPFDITNTDECKPVGPCEMCLTGEASREEQCQPTGRIQKFECVVVLDGTSVVSSTSSCWPSSITITICQHFLTKHYSFTLLPNLKILDGKEELSTVFQSCNRTVLDEQFRMVRCVRVAGSKVIICFSSLKMTSNTLTVVVI